jgi:hypothetical protein
MKHSFDHTGDTFSFEMMARGLQGINDESWGLEDLQVSISCGGDPYPVKIYMPVISR